MTEIAADSAGETINAPDTHRWYVAKTHPNGEEKALFHLRRQGFKVYLPRYLRRISHARRISWQPRPLFPSYLFVTINGPDQRWAAINSTIGIAHMICDERGPLPVPAGRKKPFEKGDKVQIMSGAFADHIGQFDGATDAEWVFVLLNLMGRQVKAKVYQDVISAHA